MKCTINIEGILTVTAESELEAYALKCWEKDLTMESKEKLKVETIDVYTRINQEISKHKWLNPLDPKTMDNPFIGGVPIIDASPTT